MFAQALQTALSKSVQDQIVAPLEAQVQQRVAWVQRYFPGATPAQIALMVVVFNVAVARFVAPIIEEGLGSAVDVGIESVRRRRGRVRKRAR